MTTKSALHRKRMNNPHGSSFCWNCDLTWFVYDPEEFGQVLETDYTWIRGIGIDFAHSQFVPLGEETPYNIRVRSHVTDKTYMFKWEKLQTAVTPDNPYHLYTPEDKKCPIHYLRVYAKPRSEWKTRSPK
jgi:hypothetical protein